MPQSNNADAPLSSINTYFSSRTEALSSILFSYVPDAEQRRANPFSTTHIVIPNSGMQRYLELNIAEHFGICSHIEMSFASRFLKARYQQVLPKETTRKYLDTRQLTFAILTFWATHKPLPKNFENTPLPTLLSQYSTAKQRYYLAEQIAKLFSSYLNERSELITAWQREITVHSHINVHEYWQMLLFNALQLGTFSGTSLQQRFHANLPHSNTTLPDVHLFGFHAIPPVQLADFAALSTQANVYAYIFNPSVTYWRDIVPESVKTEKNLTAEAEAELMTVGNPLLAAWGQSGKYLIEQLNESIYPPTHVDEWLQEQHPLAINSVLTWVQAMVRDWDNSNDILTDNTSQTLTALVKEEMKTGNFSLSLHAGASPRREVEILYDTLCQQFSEQSLNPSDVLVMVPNLRDYAPHIQSIFGADTNHAIPFSLANQTAAEADPDTQAFLALLNLIDSDFSAQSLIDVISEAHIKQAFNLSLTNVETIRYWLTESRYAKHYRDNSHGRAGSLEKLLDALLLACIGGDGCQVDTDDFSRSALPSYQNSQRDSLLSFCRLINQLSRFTCLNQWQLSVSAWRDTLSELASDFLGNSNRITPRLQQWHDSILSAEHSPQQAKIINETFDYDTITTDITALLENEELHGPFLSGGISFCAMVPMRSIPAKIICLLGLNQSFPSVVAKDPLDLRHAKPLWSDRNINKEYKYLFLETLMATRQRLYLSHVGQDEKTGQAILPSILVDELFAFVGRHSPEYAQNTQHTYPLQSFLNTQKPTYQALYRQPPAVKNNTLAPNGNDESALSIPALPRQMSAIFIANSLCQPLHLYLRQHLSATAINLPDKLLAEHDMVSLDSGLEKWQYRESVLTSQLFHKDMTSTLIQQNCYPPELISQPLLMHAQSQIAPLVSALQPFVDMGYQPQSHFVKGQLVDVDFHLLWEAPYCGSLGQWAYSSAANSAKKTLRLWVNHVLLNHVQGLSNYHSHLLTLDKEQALQTTFAPFDDMETAKTALTQILTCITHVFNTPYAALLAIASKKSEEILQYQSEDYPLYPRLSAQANYHKDCQLNTYFEPIENSMRQYLTTFKASK